MAAPPDLGETHHRLSKKVAQLTKVVVHLHTLNENVEFDKQKLKDAHSREVLAIREESDSKINLLNNEIQAKQKALQELTVQAVTLEKEAQQRLADAEKDAQQRLANAEKEAERRRVTDQNEAKLREINLQTQHEEEIKSLTTRLSKDLSSQAENITKLEESAKKHKSEVALIQENLKKDNQSALKQLREELTDSHSNELNRLKTQHEKAMARLKVDAAEHEKVEIENAIYQGVIEHNKKLQAVKAEVTNRLNADITSLQDELSDAKIAAQEIPVLRAKLREHVDAEKKLNSEVRRLSDSLDASTSSNQRIIDQLRGDNHDLRTELSAMKEALRERAQQVDEVMEENNDLRRTNDLAEEEIASLQFDITKLEEKCCKMCDDIDEKDGLSAALTAELDELRAKRLKLGDQIERAQHQIAHLSQYKLHVEKSREQMKSIRSELNKSKKDVYKIKETYDSLQSLAANWQSRMKTLHFTEILKLDDQMTFLQGEVDRLGSIKITLERNNKQANTSISNLEQKVNSLEKAAANVDSARSGERLSWEKAMEELKAQHKKEKFHLQIQGQDERDILQNQIVRLQTEFENKLEHNENRYQILEAECSNKMESLKAALSKEKYESAVQNQTFAKEKDILESQVAAHSREGKIFNQNIAVLEQDIDRLQHQHQSVIETLKAKHRQNVEETMRIHVELFRQHSEKHCTEKQRLAEQLKHTEQQMDNIRNSSQLKARSVQSRTLSAFAVLQETKHMFHELQFLTQQHHDTQDLQNQFKSELSTNLQSIRVRSAAIVEQEKAACKEAMSTLDDSCNKKIAAANKEVHDAKQMLFQSIREYETKLEREVRILKDEHNLHISALANDSKDKHDVLTSNLKKLHSELEAVIAVGGEKNRCLSEKETIIRQLEMKIIDITKAHHDEMQSVRSQHESERDGIMRDFLSKETAVKKKFEGEISRLLTELESAHKQLNEANDQFVQSVSNDVQNMEQIKTLQNELKTLASTEASTREKMLYFKRELENRETNYNTRFKTPGMRHQPSTQDDDKSDNAGVLRVIQSSTKKDDAKKMAGAVKKQQNQTRKKITAGSKKKATKTKKATTSLPKLAKSS